MGVEKRLVDCWGNSKPLLGEPKPPVGGHGSPRRGKAADPLGDKANPIAPETRTMTLVKSKPGTTATSAASHGMERAAQQQTTEQNNAFAFMPALYHSTTATGNLYESTGQL